MNNEQRAITLWNESKERRLYARNASWDQMIEYAPEVVNYFRELAAATVA